MRLDRVLPCLTQAEHSSCLRHSFPCTSHKPSFARMCPRRGSETIWMMRFQAILYHKKRSHRYYDMYSMVRIWRWGKANRVYRRRVYRKLSEIEVLFDRRLKESSQRLSHAIHHYSDHKSINNTIGKSTSVSKASDSRLRHQVNPRRWYDQWVPSRKKPCKNTVFFIIRFVVRNPHSVE